MQLSTETCNLAHGLPSTLFWSHKQSICGFMERIAEQRNNLLSFEKQVVSGRVIKQSVEVSIFGSHGRVFSNKQNIKHNDIIRLMDRAIRKMKTRNGPKKNWNIEQISILIWIVHQFQHFFKIQFYDLNHQNWESISSYIPGKTANQCLFRMLKFQKSNLSQYPWTKQEQARLGQLVGNLHKKDWNRISEELYFKSYNPKVYRLPKQCRQHWSSYMIHQLKKGPWSSDEDISLLEAVMKIGKKWTEIGKQLLGRTQNAIKNRCNLLLSKYQKTSEETDFNKNIKALIEKIKSQNQTKVSKKLNRRRTRKSSLIGTSFKQQQSILLSQQHLIKREENQKVEHSESIYDEMEVQDEVFKNNDAIRTFTHIEGIGIGQIHDHFEPEDIGRFLFIDEFQVENLSELSFPQILQ